MAFAGHLKSISLHQNPESGLCEPLSMISPSRVEREELQRQVRLKRLEVEQLRAKIQIATTPVVASKANERQSNLVIVNDLSSTGMVVDDRGNAPSRSLWIGNTPLAITTSELRASFCKYGKIESTKCLKDYSFVNFENIDGAIAAWKDCHEKELYQRGRPLWIRFTATQAESRRTKDPRLDRRPSTTMRMHSSQESAAQNMPSQRSSASFAKDEHDVQWPSGPPPSEPKSHRREISPPPLWRADTYRPASNTQHSYYRPKRKYYYQDLKLNILTQVDYVSRHLRSRRSSSSSLSDRSSLRSLSRASSETPTTASPLPWERSHRKRKLSDVGVVRMVTDSGVRIEPSRKAPLHNESATSDAIDFIRAKSTSADHDARPALQPFQQVPGPELRAPNCDLDGSSVQSRSTEVQYSFGIDDGCRGMPERPSLASLLDDTDHLKKDTFSLILPTLPPSALPRPNKRLRLDKDECSSVHSGQSSLSNSSNKDRRCRGCKKPGNVKGLHVLYKCSTCQRRYHGFCGRPKPNECSDKSSFVCGRCMRDRAPINSKDDTQSECSETAHQSNQLASPPLSHDNIDNELTANHFDQISIGERDASGATATTSFQPYSPASPAELIRQEDIGYYRIAEQVTCTHSEVDKSVTDRQSKLPYSKHIGTRNRAPETTKAAMNKYKTVTCPWWRKGGRCWLLEEDCLYAHRETRILSPDEFQSNHHWTCYYWLRQLDCPSGMRECLFAHHDTGLHTSKDGRASLKHVTCYWWVSRGSCKHREEDCRYAHIDTGLYSRDPSNKRSGTAISSIRPSRRAYDMGQVGAKVDNTQRLQYKVSDDMSPASPTASVKSLAEGPDDQIHGHERRVSARSAVTSMAGTTSLTVPSEIECRRVKERKDSSGSSTEAMSLTTLEHVAQQPLHRRGSNLEGNEFTTTIDVLSTSIDPKSLTSTTTMACRLPINLRCDQPQVGVPIHERTSTQADLASDLVGTKKTSITSSEGRAALTSEYAESRDPRKRLRSMPKLTVVSSDTLGCTSPTTSRAQAQASPSTEIVASPLEICSPGKTGLPGSNYKKCKVCAKIVFSGDTCRDCRTGQKPVQNSASSDGQASAQRDDSGGKVMSTSQSGDPVHTSMNEALRTTLDSFQQLKQTQRPTLKRGNTSDDLFIPNKRPTSCMLFSSTNRVSSADPSMAQHKTKVAKATETMRKPPAPTLHQLLEQKRVHVSRPLNQEESTNRILPGQAITTSSSQSNKEDIAPTAEEDEPPLTSQFPGSQDLGSVTEIGTKNPVTAVPDTNYAISQQSGMLHPQITASPEPVDMMNSLPNRRSEQGNSTALFLRKTTPVPEPIRVQHIEPQKEPAECPGRRPIKYSCPDCAKKHRRCTHNGKLDEGQLLSRKMLQAKDDRDQANQRLAVHDFGGKEAAASSDKALPYVCSICRAHHKKCLHGENGLQLDPVKCRQYLRDRGNKRDTSRSLSEWEGILNAAQMIRRNSSQSSAEVFENRSERSSDESISSAGELKGGENNIITTGHWLATESDESDSDADHTEAITQLFRMSFRSPTKDKSVISPNASRQLRPAMVRTSTLNIDDDHVRKLKNEGVMFESEEDDADYYSDDQAAMVLHRPIADPLHVHPSESLDLFEICPHLHPDHLKCTQSHLASQSGCTKTSRKAEWAELRTRRLNERRNSVGNAHWEVDRNLRPPMVSTLVERLIPAPDAEINRFSIPTLEKREQKVTFLDFLGGPKQPEACLTSDGSLAFRDGARDCDQTSFARSARGFGRRVMDDDNFPVSLGSK